VRSSLALVLALAAVSAGCTINLVKKSGEPERFKQQVELFKWLYDKGAFQADPEGMRRVAARLLDVSPGERAAQAPPEPLERLLLRIDAAIDRLLEPKPAPSPAPSPSPQK
jgi:hypothetical protein